MKLGYRSFLYEAVDYTQTPAFKQWFGNSAVVDDDGNPLDVYHGTTHDFEVFDIKKTYKEAYVGGGFYFSSNPKDAESNYAGKGPDAENKIEQMAENIENQDAEEISNTLGLSIDEVDAATDDGSLSDIVREYAEKQVLGDNPSPNIMPVYLRILKPFYLGDSFGQYFDYNDGYDPDTEEEGEPSGLGAELINALKENLDDVEYVDNNKIFGKIMEDLEPYEGFSSTDFFKAIKNRDELIDAYRREEEVKVGDFFKDVILSAGFDGVIMDASTFAGMKEVQGTLHYIVYSPNQVKSIFNKNPTNDPNITKE